MAVTKNSKASTVKKSAKSAPAAATTANAESPVVESSTRVSRRSAPAKTAVKASPSPSPAPAKKKSNIILYNIKI